jgi:hypothetical protein
MAVGEPLKAQRPYHTTDQHRSRYIPWAMIKRMCRVTASNLPGYISAISAGRRDGHLNDVRVGRTARIGVATHQGRGGRRRRRVARVAQLVVAHVLLFTFQKAAMEPPMCQAGYAAKSVSVSRSDLKAAARQSPQRAGRWTAERVATTAYGASDNRIRRPPCAPAGRIRRGSRLKARFVDSFENLVWT